MRENKYFEEYRGQGGSAPAYCFDRILLGGGVFAAAYLVGHARCFGDEDAFALSDHYGLMGLLDVHEAHAGARGGRVAVRRREALGLARDQAASRERVVARELQAAALEQARQQRSRAEEGEVAERLNLARRREAAERRERYEATFGRESFFACADWVERVAEVPVSPGASQEVRLAGYEGLARASVQAGWERRGRYPVLSGFSNVRNTCFAASVVQVLLRVPAVIVWLEAHAQLCSRGRDECLTCALRETQGQLGVRGAEPFLCRQEAIARVSAFFADGQQHDACEFVLFLLEGLAQAEESAGRSGTWPGSQWGVASHVDRLFGFVEEMRRVCGECGSGEWRFSTDRILPLSLPALAEDGCWGPSELYVRHCAKVEGRREPCCERCSVERARFAEQRRLVDLPNVLVVQVKRTKPDGSVCRAKVKAEEQFSVHGSSVQMELWGVVYHDGPRADRGHYRAACRGPDRVFWLFDDLRVPRRLSTDVSSYGMRQVVLLVYVRMGGRAVLAGGLANGGDEEGGGAVRGGEGNAEAAAGGAARGEVGGSFDAGGGVVGSKLDGSERGKEAGDEGKAGRRAGEGLAGTPERSGATVGRKRGERPSPAAGSSRPTPLAKRVKCEVCGGDVVVEGGVGQTPVRSPPRKCGKCGGAGSGVVAEGLVVPELPAFPAALAAVGAGVTSGDRGNGGSAAGSRGGAERWRLFTPGEVDERKCMARVWNGGEGAQCSKPACEGRLCKMHAGKRGGPSWLGEVTGEIPAGKLGDFEKALRRKEAKRGGVRGERADGEEACAGGEGAAMSESVGSGVGGVGRAGDVVQGSGGRGGGVKGRVLGAGFAIEVGGAGVGAGSRGGSGGASSASGGGRGRGRVVSGFGEGRVEDVRALEERRDAEACDRQRIRREEGERGRAVDFQGRELKRSEGGAFSLRKD